MATPRYDALVNKLRNWSNRDAEILNNAQVNDCLEYAADDCYRLLRIPPLEAILTYTAISADDAGNRILNIPSDLSSFIQLRRQFETSGGGQIGTSPYIVYTEKADIRSFYDIETCKYEFNRWTRQGNQIHVYPDLNEGDVFELYYYRRLGPLNSVYVVNVANAVGIDPTVIGNTNGFMTVVEAPMDTTMPGDACELFYIATTDAMTMETTYQFFTTAQMDDEGVTTTTSFWATGNESPHWLKDDHERTILYGGLYYAFSFLQEPEQMAIYKRLFDDEIMKLNDEENLRKYQGGGSQVHFATGGLI